MIEAAAYYEAQQCDLGRRFLASVQDSINRIVINPQLYPIRHQLQELGVPGDNIYDANLCTSCASEWFYSHRKEGGITGRMLNFIMINDKILS